MISLAHARDISTNCINGLRSGFQERVLMWWEQMWKLGVKAYIYEGYRSEARQAVLYAQGRTTPGKIVTNAGPGQSMHGYGLAYDWTPLKQVDKAADLYDCDWDNEDQYKIGQDLGKTLCMRSLSWETPHLEDGGYVDWRDAKSRLSNSDYNSWRT